MGDYTLQEIGDTLAQHDLATFATKNELADLIGTAPETLDTLGEIADTISNLATISYVDQVGFDVNNLLTSDIATALQDAKDYTDAREIAITTAYEGYATDADALILEAAKAYTDEREPLIILDAQAYADQSELDAIAAANLYTDTAVAGATVDLTGYATETYVGEQIAAIPAVDFTGYATETYVGEQIAAIPAVDFTGYATETYVGEQIAAIPATDLSSYYTSAQTDTAISTAIGNIPTTDLSSYYTSTETDTAISTAIGNIPAVDFTGYATETYVNDAVSGQAGVTLLAAQQYADQLALDGVVDLSGYATIDGVNLLIGDATVDGTADNTITDRIATALSTANDNISTAIGNIDYSGFATTQDVSDLSGTYVAQTSLQALPATGKALYASANTLYLAHADGTEDTVDLNLYLDNTNLAYIQSGSLDNTTGVVTFTRNDDSTFDIDMSALLDLELPRIDSAAFDDTTGILTLARLADDSSVTVSLDGRYLTSFTESDPVFTGSAAYGIASADISNWNTAHGWGDHNTVGYMMPTDKAADSELLDGYNSTQFLGPLTGVLPQATLSVKPAEGVTYTEQRFHITDTTNGDSLSRIYYDGSRMYIQAGAANDGAAQSSGNLSFTGYYGTDIGTLQVRHSSAWQNIWHDAYVTAGNGISVSAGTIAMTGSYTGNFEATGDLTAYSDARLKSDVETIDGALDIVKQLRGVCYVKDGHEGVGVIAQEVEEVLPQVVHDSPWTEFKSVAYGNMVGVLIEAIKEQQTQIEALKEEINKLKG